jgi:hypothetical protein
MNDHVELLKRADAWLTQWHEPREAIYADTVLIGELAAALRAAQPPNEEAILRVPAWRIMLARAERAEAEVKDLTERLNNVSDADEREMKELYAEVERLRALLHEARCALLYPASCNRPSLISLIDAALAKGKE